MASRAGEECSRLPGWVRRLLLEAEHGAAPGQGSAVLLRERGRPDAVVIMRATAFVELRRRARGASSRA